MLNISLLCADLMSDWLVNAVPIIRDILLILIGITALIIIISVLFQTSSGGDATAITGGSETYYSQNKGTSIEDKLNRITKICSIIMVCLVVVYFVIRLSFPESFEI
ncbi:MAG: preprotein translocase subunit SecG [Clostridia bacterium]|nr:preprotein translocase subunit SecG [Clostridia bacterium]